MGKKAPALSDQYTVQDINRRIHDLRKLAKQEGHQHQAVAKQHWKGLRKDGMAKDCCGKRPDKCCKDCPRHWLPELFSPVPGLDG